MMSCKQLFTKYILLTAMASAVFVVGSGTSLAKDADFPTKDVRIIVPWGAGGSSDVMVRAFSKPFAEALGTNVLVVNRPGGGSSIGATEAAKAKPDGYTLLHSTGSTFVTVPLKEKVLYSPEDFRSIISLGDNPLVMITGKSTGWTKLEDVKEGAGDSIKIAITSKGNALHLVGSNFIDAIGRKSVSLPFSAVNESAQAVANGDAELAVIELSIAQPQIESGRVIALATAADKRLKTLPDVPTFGEAGYPNSADHYSRVALSVPADTPEPIVQTLKEAGKKALQDSSWKKFAEQTLVEEPGYPGERFMTEYVPNAQSWTLDSFPAAGVTPVSTK